MPGQSLRALLTLDPTPLPKGQSGRQTFSIAIRMGGDVHVLNGMMGSPGSLPEISSSPGLPEYLNGLARSQAPQPQAQRSATLTTRTAIAGNDLGPALRQTASAINGRMTLGDGLAISAAQTDGSRLILKSQKAAGAGGISSAERQEMKSIMCSLPAFTRLLRDGATIRLEYAGTGKMAGRSVEADLASCISS